MHYEFNKNKDIYHIKSEHDYSVDLILHGLRVAVLSKLIGEEMGFNSRDLEILYKLSNWHDIGKSKIDSRILYKPNSLNKYEWEEIKKHPIYSEQIYLSIIRNSPRRFEFAKIIRHHHENIDGSGYPDGVRGDEIHIFSKIISIADCFDAITNIRVYRPYVIKNPIEEIEKDINKKFDADVFKYAKKVFENYSGPQW